MCKRLTREEIIQKARKKHGDKYDYSKLEYINYHSKVRIICPVHGEFEQRLQAHLDGQGCPKCGVNTRVTKRTLTKEEFINRAKEKHGDKYDYSKVEYINIRTKVRIVCPIHGEFLQVPYKHLKGNGCEICNRMFNHRVEGIGVNDSIGSSDSEIYKKWRQMLHRCYDLTEAYKRPTYDNCFVCEEWLTFSNFKKWFDKHYVEGWHLDKDVIVKNNKIYSPLTCCFVPREINNLFRIGVSEKTKQEKSKKYAEKYKDQLDDRVYNALTNY